MLLCSVFIYSTVAGRKCGINLIVICHCHYYAAQVLWMSGATIHWAYKRPLNLKWMIYYLEWSPRRTDGGTDGPICLMRPAVQMVDDVATAEIGEWVW